MYLKEKSFYFFENQLKSWFLFHFLPKIMIFGNFRKIPKFRMYLKWSQITSDSQLNVFNTNYFYATGDVLCPLQDHFRGCGRGSYMTPLSCRGISWIWRWRGIGLTLETRMGRQKLLVCFVRKTKTSLFCVWQTKTSFCRKKFLSSSGDSQNSLFKWSWTCI